MDCGNWDGQDLFKMNIQRTCDVHLDSGLVWFPQLPCTLVNASMINLVYNKKHIQLYSKHNTKI